MTKNNIQLFATEGECIGRDDNFSFSTEATEITADNAKDFFRYDHTPILFNGGECNEDNFEYATAIPLVFTNSNSGDPGKWIRPTKIEEQLKEHGLNYWIYASWHHMKRVKGKDGRPQFQVVLPLSQPLYDGDEYARLCNSCIETFGSDPVVNVMSLKLFGYGENPEAFVRDWMDGRYIDEVLGYDISAAAVTPAIVEQECDKPEAIVEATETVDTPQSLVDENVAEVKLAFHELCLLFPQADEKTLSELTEDIRKNGLRDEITTYQGKILDGRNRYDGCIAAGVKPRFVEYTGDDPLGFVISKNLHRRHLNESQRAMIASKIATLPAHRPTKDKEANLPTYGARTQEQAAKAMNVSERQVRDAARLRREASDEVVAEVENGNKTIHGALKETKPVRTKQEASTVEQSKSAKNKPPKVDEVEDVALDAGEQGEVECTEDRLFEAFESFLNDPDLTSDDRIPVCVELFRMATDSFVGFHRPAFLEELSNVLAVFNFQSPLA